MTATVLILAAVVLLALQPIRTSAVAAEVRADTAVQFNTDEISRILSLGPWPPPGSPRQDRSNRLSGNPAAAEFGRLLFESPQLSVNRQVACTTCHRPDLDFTDGQRRSQGIGRHDRNAQTLWNISLQRWFGWDGGADSLWAASIRPLEAPHEMGMTASAVRSRINSNPQWRERYLRLFGEAAGSSDPDRVLANTGKAIAAYLETLWSPPTAFDRFRNALAQSDSPAAAAASTGFTPAAQRGLKLFIGHGNCTVCHFGPNFSNGEFHDVAIPFMIEPGRVDPGRHTGIRRVLSDRFNLASQFNDEDEAATRRANRLPESIRLRTLQPQHRNWGEWRTPSLRNLARTGPYMHDGSLATLHDVARHYNTINLERLHADGEQLLRPLGLAPSELDDLVTFLKSLSPSP